MSVAIFLALASYCLAASITPGPNNMMLLSSGATFGLRRTVPHLVGIAAGCAVMVLALGWCLAGIADHLPAFYMLLHIVSTAYLLWLAWRIATSKGPNAAGLRDRPLRALDAAAFQWINPKAWVLVLGAVTSFARPGHMVIDVPVIAGVLTVFCSPCFALWAGSGSLLKRFLQRPRALRTFNLLMAALLMLSIMPGLWRDAQRIWAGGFFGPGLAS